MTSGVLLTTVASLEAKIEEQAQEIERLRWALEEIVALEDDTRRLCDGYSCLMAQIARRALGSTTVGDLLDAAQVLSQLNLLENDKARGVERMRAHTSLRLHDAALREKLGQAEARDEKAERELACFRAALREDHEKFCIKAEREVGGERAGRE